MADPRDTPAMRQYYRYKRQFPDCALFFRIGDFYEMFDDDAVRVSKALGLTLTKRTEGVPMCGVPYHQLETYLRKAITAGFRVAVCEQTETPEAAKERAKSSGGGSGGAVIERAVTRVLTPGTLIDENLLDADAPSLLACVCFLDSGDTGPAACAVADLSTGRFEVFDAAAANLADELSRRAVSELLYAQTADGEPPARIKSILSALNISGTPQPSWHFRLDESREALLKQYQVATLEGFGLAPDDPLIRPAGALIRYLQQTQNPCSGSSPEGGGMSIAPAMDAEGAGGRNTTGPSRTRLAHLSPPTRTNHTDACILDGTTLRALEVLRTIRAVQNPLAQDNDGSLLGIFATTKTFPGCRTPMGKRLLREWLCRPLRDIAQIQRRQKCVSTLIEDRRAADQLTAALADIQDIARISGRLALNRANPRDLVALGRSLTQITPVADAITNAPAFASHAKIIADLKTALAPLADRIAHSCVEAPPPHLREGGLFKDGFDAELDECRLLQRDAAAWMADYQAKLIAEHDLPSLKVGFNKIFGFYIELPSAQSKRAPVGFTRKQTLKSAERYITPELKEFETKVLTAESRALAREQLLFDALCDQARALIPAITRFADAVAELDVLACFADKAHRRRWTKPEIVDSPVLHLEQARHPVLDERLENNFVPNDLSLGSDEVTKSRSDADQEPHPGIAGKIGPTSPASSLRHSLTPSLALITGPNMAGKSTFIRTAALLTLLAHTGSFVPADRAIVGLTDRIFTRIGADDALHAGQSTFMVEMTETARILNHATPQSLIILDEIGRGTSTLDGLSLAWAIAETLASGLGSRVSGLGSDPQNPKPETRDPRPDSPRTLFATHYHELTDLEDLLPGRVTNLHVSVREWGDQIVFLHRILPGRTDQSYGIHVAKLAGIPANTIARAREVLESLAVHHVGSGSSPEGGGMSVRSTDAEGAEGKTPTSKSRKSKSPSPTLTSPQLPLFTEYLAHPAVAHLKEIKLDSLTPLEAFDALRKLKALTDPTSKA